MRTPLTVANPVHVQSKAPSGARPTRASRIAVQRQNASAEAAEFETLMADTAAVGFIKDPDGRYVYANPFLVQHLSEPKGGEWLGKTDLELWPDVAARIRADDLTIMRTKSMHIRSQVMPFEDGPHDVLIISFPLEGEAGRTSVAAIGIDRTERLALEADLERMAAVVEQVDESVVMTDLEALITYVNPAFERVTGYSSEEVVGKNPRILKSGTHSPDSYRAMWAALVHGVPWAADLVNRRKDGSVFTEEAFISPIRDASGQLTSYVAVKRDVTDSRTLEGRSAERVRERALIGGMIRSIRPSDTVETTAQAICQQVLSLSVVAGAQLFVFGLDGRATPIGSATPHATDAPLERLPRQRSRHLRVRATEGPWIEAWTGRSPADEAPAGTGPRLAAHAPVRWDGNLIGLLVVDAGTVSEADLTDSLGAVVEFADLAAALIGRDVAARAKSGRARNRIGRIIERGQFHPVFQPIVDLHASAIVGYEALTRFDDGVPPNVRFDEATAIGVGLELEAATLKAALAAATALPTGPWLNVNASPGFIEDGRRFRSVLDTTERHVVLEVTEHAAIADYGAFHETIADLRPRVELAIDDAGAGFASLRHILELRPDFVKVDRSIVAGLDTDPARQALMVGLRHFVHATECRLIAEGVETEGERDTLRSLDIRLGQGYLLGRPLPASGP
jgi:PAS domain S-box-containing protein